MESIELDNIDNTRRQEEDENEEEEEKDWGGGSDENDLLDNPGWLSNRGRVVIDVNHLDPLKKLFGDSVNEARNIGFFIKDVLLMEKEECTKRSKGMPSKGLLSKDLKWSVWSRNPSKNWSQKEQVLKERSSANLKYVKIL